MNKEANLYDIAIVGMTGRFPGANTVEEFWDNLVGGVESIRRFSDEELAAAGVAEELMAHPDYVKAGAILEGTEYFDAAFFGFTPKEAAIMNPQQRLFLECAWEVLERAGYDPDSFPGRIGVYAGAATNHYLAQNGASDAMSGADSISGLQVMVGNEPDYLATQVAYKLNLTGPALTIQTACSTSLVAVHQACQSLLSNECDMALAGGATIFVPQVGGYLYVEGSINAPDGHCRAFDAKAQGTVPGNGVGIVLLKRLEDALEEGDSIIGLVKGSAINNDGAAKIGYTAPSLEGQANVIADAQSMADVDLESITYIETHGTGTILGDPIEIGALTQVFRATTDKIGFCKLGAVKSNIGHLGAAAGVAGLIKTLLALQNQCIPPTLHYTEPNPNIDFANSPFVVNTKATSWLTNGAPRRAGVSSFGIGGTNAHLILEEAPVVPKTEPSRPWQMLMLSAVSPDALEQMSQNLHTYLDSNANINLGDVAYTLQVGRKRSRHSRLLVCQTADEAVAALAQPAVDPVLTMSKAEPTQAVVFMFSGQGSQYIEMGRELYVQELLFRQTVDECAQMLYADLGLDLRTTLYPNEIDRASATKELNQTALTQPALFVIEYALAQLWKSWGIEPQAMIGHSIGEYVAACLAGVFSLRDALHIVATRGRLMQQQPSGEMLAISLPSQAVQPYLRERPTLALAAINGAEQTVVAGPAEAISALESTLREQGIRVRGLSTSHAFHSAMMDPMLEPFAAAVAQIQLNPPQIPYLSNLTGTWITATQATDPAYWAQLVRQTVNFAAGMEKLIEHPEWMLLEVGPGTALSNLAKRDPQRDVQQSVLASLPHANDKRTAQQFLLQTLGQLYLHGVNVDWSSFYRDETRQRILLPTYPFQRQRHWIDTPSRAASPLQAPIPNEKLPLEEWFAIPTWQQSPPAALLPQIEQIEQTEETKIWLLFVDKEGLGQQVAQRLREQKQTVITVTSGATFGVLDANHYTLNPAARDQYQALFAALHEKQQAPHAIVHLWQVSHNRQDLSVVERLQAIEQVYEHGFDSLLLLAQVLGERSDREAQQLIVISNQLHSVTGDEAIIPEKATLLGCCRVIAQEYAHITCRSIDILLPQSEKRVKNVTVEQLLDELTCQSTDTMVAYRGRHRWIPSFESVTLLEQAQPVAQERAVLRKEGVYLITAALSKTGLRIAHYLAQRVAAKLVLIDANMPPDGPSDASEEAQLTQLEALGAEVLFLQADVTDLAQMKTTIQRATTHFGQIHGVIHIPVTTNDGVIQLKSVKETRKVLDPCVTGTLVLEAVLQETALDFMALFGSTVSISGGIGQVEECAAYAFLDAYAHSRYNTPANDWQTVVSAIDWSLWQWDDRFEQSMASFAEVQAQFRELREIFGITQDEAGDALLRVLASKQPQLVVSSQGVESVLEQQRILTIDNVATQLKTPNSASQGTSQEFEMPVDELEASIAEVWQDIFGMAQIGRHDNFFDLGGHSLLSIQLISRLRKTLQLPELALSILFEAPTVATLTETVRASLQPPELTLEEMLLSEDTDLAALIAEIEGLSEDELAAALEIDI